MKHLWPRGQQDSLSGTWQARLAIFLFVSVLSAILYASPAEAQTQSSGGYEATGADIPPEYLAQYRAWSEAYGLDWTVLAGVGKVESDHGAYGTAGCIPGPPTAYGQAYGPMQFLPSTWKYYGVDADGDGYVDSCDYQDAIPATADYLARYGAPEDYYSALYAYNHSDRYVGAVLNEARDYYTVYGG